jgi:hypothetical protein
MADADPAARRRALIVLAVCAGVGAGLIFGFGQYRQALLDWVAADPVDARRRASLVFLVSAGLFVAPLFVFAAYLWSFGTKVIRAESFPPPGHRVIRDTPSLAGAEAIRRGRSFKALAMVLAGAALLLWVFAWRLAMMFAGRSS